MTSGTFESDVGCGTILCQWTALHTIEHVTSLAISLEKLVPILIVTTQNTPDFSKMPPTRWYHRMENHWSLASIEFVFFSPFFSGNNIAIRLYSCLNDCRLYIPHMKVIVKCLFNLVKCQGRH